MSTTSDGGFGLGHLPRLTSVRTPRPLGRRPIVSLLITGLGRGGAETQFVALSRYLKSSGWDVEVASLRPARPPSSASWLFLTELERSEIPVRCPRAASGGALLRHLFELLRHLRARRPDVLCTFMFHANVFGRVLGRLARVPVVVSSIRNERFGPRWREQLEAVTERLCDITVVNSEHVAASLVARGVIQKAKCRVIPNAVDFGRFCPREPTARTSIRKALRVPQDAFLWLAVARLEPNKNHLDLLRAVALLRERYPGLRLAIAGDGPLRESLRSASAKMALEETVHWLGLRDDVPDLLLASDAFVLSSRWEGSPNALLEALAGGLPVVATTVGGVRELVEDGTSGFLVAPEDPTALGAAMERVMTLPSELRDHMGERGRMALRQRHDAISVLEQWRRLLSHAGTTR